MSDFLIERLNKSVETELGKSRIKYTSWFHSVYTSASYSNTREIAVQYRLFDKRQLWWLVINI